VITYTRPDGELLGLRCLLQEVSFVSCHPCANFRLVQLANSRLIAAVEYFKRHGVGFVLCHRFAFRNGLRLRHVVIVIDSVHHATGYRRFYFCGYWLYTPYAIAYNASVERTQHKPERYTVMTVRELRQLLFDIEDQDAQVVLVKEIRFGEVTKTAPISSFNRTDDPKGFVTIT